MNQMSEGKQLGQYSSDPANEPESLAQNNPEISAKSSLNSEFPRKNSLNISGLPPIMPNLTKRIISEQFDPQNYPGKKRDLRNSSKSSSNSLASIAEENEDADLIHFAAGPSNGNSKVQPKNSREDLNSKK